jgi:chromosome partitioning protein
VILSIYNQKGGAGKSTTAVNLACVWALEGRRVLLLDCDRQGNVGTMLGIPVDELPRVTSDLFSGEAPLRECIVAGPVDGLDVVVGDRALSNVEHNLQGMKRREEVLARQLEDELGDYDVILVDCPPSQGLLAINAVLLSSALLVPVRMTDTNAVNGLVDLRLFLAELAEVGWARPVLGILRLDCKPRQDIYQSLDASLEIAGDWPLLTAQVPHTTKVEKSVLRGSPIVLDAPDSAPAIAYREAARELTAALARATARAA